MRIDTWNRMRRLAKSWSLSASPMTRAPLCRVVDNKAMAMAAVVVLQVYSLRQSSPRPRPGGHTQE